MEQEISQTLEFDIFILIKLVLRKWWQVCIFVFVALLIFGYYSFKLRDDVFTAESSMIVQVTTENDSAYTELQTGRILADTYTEFAQSNLVLNQVRNELDLNYDNEELSKMISISSVSDTPIVKLTVEGLDAVEVTKIANEIVSVVQTEAKNFEGLEDVEVLDTAVQPSVPSGPNRLLFMVIGALIGGMIGVGFVVILEFTNQTIKTGKDVENRLGLRLLGVVPEYDMDEGVES